MPPAVQIYQRSSVLGQVSDPKLGPVLGGVAHHGPKGRDHALLSVRLGCYKAAKATVVATKYSLAIRTVVVAFDMVGKGNQEEVHMVRANNTLVKDHKLGVGKLKVDKVAESGVGESVDKEATKLEEECMVVRPKGMVQSFIKTPEDSVHLELDQG